MYQPNFFDAGVFPSHKEDIPAGSGTLELRDYQVQAVEELRDAFGQGCKRPLLQAPTGAGKTVISAYIAKGAVEKGNRVLFVAPFLELLEQTQASFRKLGIRSTIWHNDHGFDSMAPVVITTAQTFTRRLQKREAAGSGYIPHFSLGIYDEAHELHEAVRNEMVSGSAKWIGLSATPWTQGLGLIFDRLVKPITMRELVDRGVLSQFVVFAPSNPDLSSVRKSRSECGYVEEELERIMGGADIIGDIFQTWQEKAGGRPTVVFAVNRAHAAKVQKEFIEGGVPCGYVDCNVTGEKRKTIIEQFKSGVLQVLVNVRALTTGFDAPVSCIVDAGPTRSKKLHVQKIGRGLRVNPGTEDCIVLDFAGNTLRLGIVTDIDQDRLSDAEKGKREASEREVEEPLPKACGSCGFVKAPKVHKCPSCGFAPQAKSEVVEKSAELVEFTAGRKKEDTFAEKCRWFSSLSKIATDRGYSEGWAAHKYRERFGVWPRNVRVDGSGRVDADIASWVKSRQIAYAKGKGAAK